MTDPAMTGPLEAYPAAAAILRNAGWAPHPQMHVFTSGTLVMGVQPDGAAMHVKDWAKIPPGHVLHSEDTPDTPEEAAVWLHAKFTNGAPIELAANDAAPGLTTVDQVLDAFDRTQEADVPSVNINVSPVFNVTGGHATSDAGAENEAHGETGEKDHAAVPTETRAPELQSDATAVTDDTGGNASVADAAMEHFDGALESDEPGRTDARSSPDAGLTDVLQSPPADEPAEAVADSVDSGADIAQDDAAENLEGADGGSAGGGLALLADDGQDGPGDSDLPSALDADFEEIGDDTLEHAAIEDLGAELLKQEEQSGGVAYFGDNFDTMKLKKIGRLTQIAMEQAAAALAFANWSDDEYTAVQAHVVSNLDKATGAYTGNRQDIYNRFVEMAEAQNHVATINRHRDVNVTYLNAADTPRLMVEQFDPEAGWPE